MERHGARSGRAHGGAGILTRVGRAPAHERVAEIDWIEASGHYLTLHAGRDEHLIRETITDMEARLDRERFVRVHRSAIVNVDCIRELLPAFHGEYTIVLRDGTRLSSSRGYSERLQAMVRRG